MTNNRAEQAENLTHKSTDHHSHQAGQSLSFEAHQTMRDQARHAAKPQEHNAMLVMGDIFNQVKNSVNHAISSDKTASFIKNDICNNDPVKEGALAVAVAGAAVVGGVLLAPEALAAAGITTTIAGAVGIMGTFAAGGLAMDYDSRHPHGN